jgi:NitT/TauT family transport system permease protein
MTSAFLRSGVARRVLPPLVIVACVLVVWYAAVPPMNWDQAQTLADDDAGWRDIAVETFALDRPVLPAPHQIAAEVFSGVFGWPLSSPRSLMFHAGVTAATTIAGLALALGLGIVLAIGIVHSRLLDRALMPWVIASQAIPVLAIAPMVVIVLGNVGITGLTPKALIAGWLSFLPITIGMVKGFRSPDPMQRDLLRTYSATGRDVFTKLRWPAAMGFLFPALRIAAPLALVGAIVAELPTGAQAGLGARLLAGSYYGQTLQIWAALFTAALLAMVLLGLVALAEKTMIRLRGGRA